MGQSISEIGGVRMTKFPTSGNQHYMFFYSIMVGGAAKGVQSVSSEQKWVGKGEGG